jgi:muramoyltetrapeptide carboxypeptidase
MDTFITIKPTHMKRRDFGMLAILGLGAGMTACVPGSRLNRYGGKATPVQVKPPRLKPGDTVGLVAPASPFSDQKFEMAVSNLQELGFRVKLGENLKEEYGYLAGRDVHRLNDLHGFFADPGVRAIWCLRGGYGTTRLLPHLDFDLIRRNPKPLIGYSDITALLMAIYQQTGLTGLHGPVASSTMTGYTREQLEKILFSPEEELLISSIVPGDADDAFQPEVIHPGKCEGQLTGGNLSLLAAMAGTPFGLDATDKLVFIEDVGEKPYRIDRMLTQLRQSARLDKAAGILLGVFNDCEPGEGDFSLTLKETLHDRLGDLGIPVYYGFSFGHVEDMCTLPMGIRAAFDTDHRVLKLLENPFG